MSKTKLLNSHKYLLKTAIKNKVMALLPLDWDNAQLQTAWANVKDDLVKHVGIHRRTLERDIKLPAGSMQVIPKARLIAYAQYFRTTPENLINE